MKHLEKENMQQSKDNLSLRNKLKQTETEIEAKVDKLLSLEKQLEEMHEAFELMSEIVFDDDNDESDPRRAQIEEIQQSFKKRRKNNESEISEVSISPAPSVSKYMSEPESELNAAYGEMYTTVASREKRTKEWATSVPIPSARAAPPRPPQPMRAPLQPKNVTPNNSVPCSPIKSNLKSPARLSQIMRQSLSKKCSFIEPPSFSLDFVPDEVDVYEPSSPKPEPLRKYSLLPAVDGIPVELVLYVSALQDKLDFHDLYVTSPETEEVILIENLKETVRKIEFNEDEMLEQLNSQTTNVLCQLVKDFFNDNEQKIINAQSEMMQSLMQSVRCCNDSEVKRLLTALSVPKQLQLAFLIRHLQSAVNAGRLPGELAGAFGQVIVSSGYRNINDPKELVEKLITLPAEFYNKMMESPLQPIKTEVTSDQSDIASEISYSSMLGPVVMDGQTGTRVGGTANWKKMIESRKEKLLTNCNIKLFMSPK